MRLTGAGVLFVLVLHPACRYDRQKIPVAMNTKNSATTQVLDGAVNRMRADGANADVTGQGPLDDAGPSRVPMMSDDDNDGNAGTGPSSLDGGTKSPDFDARVAPMDGGNGSVDVRVAPVDGGDANVGVRVAPVDGGDANVDARQQVPDDTNDAGVDDGDSGSPPPPPLPGLCVAGFECALVVFNISADFGPPVADGVIELSDGTRSVELRVVNNNGPQAWLPLGRSLIARTTVPGFWIDEALVVPLPTGNMQPTMTTYVFSTVSLNAFTMPAGQTVDETQAFAVVGFNANYPGAGVDLGVPSATPIVQSSQGLIASDTMVAGGGALMLFANVPPGKLSPVPVSPPAFGCSLTVNDLEYVAAPKTVLRFFASCVATGP